MEPINVDKTFELADAIGDAAIQIAGTKTNSISKFIAAFANALADVLDVASAGIGEQHRQSLYRFTINFFETRAKREPKQ